MKAIQSLRLRLHSGPSTLLRAERRRFARLFYGPTEVGPFRVLGVARMWCIFTCRLLDCDVSAKGEVFGLSEGMWFALFCR